jgi:hypothetical protein
MDPSRGGFLSQDTYMGSSMDPPSLHKYAYVHQNPVSNIDPSGNITLSGLMSATSSVVRLGLKIFALYTLYEFASEEVSPLVTALIDVVVGGPAGLASDALNGGVGSPIPGEPVEKHHTIPEYLCGHGNQVLSRVPVSQHRSIHASLVALRVSIAAGQKLVVEKILRKPNKKDPNKDRLLLGGSSWGRGVIAESIQFVYEWVGWDVVGDMPIGTVFSFEKGPFIRYKTSYPQCKKGAT